MKKEKDKPTAINCILQQFAVPFEYPVHFTRDVFASANDVLVETIIRLNEGRRHRVQVFIDEGVVRATPGICAKIVAWFEARFHQLELVRPPAVVPGGEVAKTSFESVRQIMTHMGDAHLDRQSFVVAVGGGSMLDVVGLAAALVHRGIRLVRIPTTVLAQDDAGLGVKNGVNHHGMKNFLGTFAPPFGVIVDFDFLKTLDFKDWIGGVSEAFKVAIIRDAEFFEYLCANASRLASRDEALMEGVIRRSAELHLEHIRSSGDPFEFGSARPLDFGHWCGHRLEVMSGYMLGHGQAVAVGIALDSVYAWREGLIDEAQCRAIVKGLAGCGLAVWDELLELRRGDGRLEILQGIDDFREHLGGRLNVTLPDGIGRKIEIHDMDLRLVEECVAYLKRFVVCP